MNSLKHILFNRFKIMSLLIISIAFSIILLMIRMKLTKSFFLLFLVWNLFLATVPFVITTYLISKEKINKFIFLIWCFIWLAFLPNAPYIITDLLHLKVSSNPFLWLDILVVGSFALVGLLLFFLSFSDMKNMLKMYLKRSIINYLEVAMLFLCGFGVYLGRFLRYNSWEIINNPTSLCYDILNILIHPNQHAEAWLFTILYGSFLGIGYWIFIQLFTNEQQKNLFQ